MLSAKKDLEAIGYGYEGSATEREHQFMHNCIMPYSSIKSGCHRVNAPRDGVWGLDSTKTD